MSSPNGDEMNGPASGTMHSTPATIQVRVIVRRAGLEDLVMVLSDAMSIASVRQQIGQSELALVHVPTGTLVENDMQLHQLADTRGEVLLELLMSDGEVKAGATAAESSGSKRGFGQTMLGALTWIGAITVVVIIIYAVRLYTKWSASRKAMVVAVPAAAPSPAAAAAAPAAAAPAAAAK